MKLTYLVPLALSAVVIAVVVYALVQVWSFATTVIGVLA